MKYAFKASQRHEIDSKIEQHQFSRGGGSCFPLKSVYPGGKSTIPGGIFLFCIFPGGKTPCECFQAETVVVGEGNRLGGGNPGCYGTSYRRETQSTHKLRFHSFLQVVSGFEMAKSSRPPDRRRRCAALAVLRLCSSMGLIRGALPNTLAQKTPSAPRPTHAVSDPCCWSDTSSAPVRKKGVPPCTFRRFPFAARHIALCSASNSFQATSGKPIP